MVDKTVASPKADSDSQQPSCSLAPGQACPGNACHKQLAALNCSVRDWIVQHVDANPVCDLTPVFKDYERYLAGIGQQSPGRAGGGSESRGSGMSVELQPAAPADSAPLPQEPAFLFSGRGQDAPEKKAEVASERRADPVQAASAAFHFGKKLDSSVLGSLSPAPPAGFSFTSGTTGLFGKDVTPGKAATPPFPTKTLESPAAGGGSESKGEGLPARAGTTLALGKAVVTLTPSLDSGVCSVVGCALCGAQCRWRPGTRVLRRCWGEDPNAVCKPMA